MSTKNAQGAVDERRLRPIYDLLENANNKKAIQEADKVLKKQPNLLCAKVLKALALLRLGKELESLELLESVRKERPTDETTLTSMAMYYRDINRYYEICELYETAKTIQPKNEDIAVSLFSAYVRVNEYKKQQLTAIALSKIKPKGQYYYWAVTSILLQALPLDELTEYCMPPLCEFKEPYIYSGTRSEANVTLLSWAEKIVDRMIIEDKIESMGEALISLVVVEARGNYNKAREMLDSLGAIIPNDSAHKKKVDLHIKMGEWDKANVELKKLLVQEPDSWVLIQFYLESVFRTMGTMTTDIGVDNSFEKALKFIDKLIEDNKGGKKRGPFLAKLELYKKRSEKKDGLLGEATGYGIEIIKYVKEFVDLDCCARDLAPYLLVLPRDILISTLNLICQEVDLPDRTLPSSALQTCLHLTNLELARASDIHSSLTCQQTDSLVSYLTNCFLATQCLTRQSDRYILLGVHYLYDIYLSSNSADYLSQAIVLVNLGLFFNPNHRQFKLCLVKLYHCLGASVPAHEAFSALDVKHMQLDSLGYLHVWPTLASGNFYTAHELLGTSLKFFNNTYKDSLEQMPFAYKYNAYSKIPEFIGIKECLNNSLQHRLVKVEQTLMLLFRTVSLETLKKHLSDAESSLVFKDPDWTNIYDNRDLNVLWNMESESKRLSRSDVEGSLGRELILLKLRCLVGRWLGAAVLTRWKEGGKEGGKESGDDTGYESGACEGSCGLEQVAREMAAALSLGVPPVRPQLLSDPPPSRLDHMLALRYFQPLLYQAHLVSALLADNPDSEKAQHYINLIFIYFRLYSCHMNNTGRNPLFKSKLLSAGVLFCELASITAALVKVLESLFRPSAEKRNKKKRDLQDEAATCWKEDIVSDLRKCVIKHSEEVLTILRREQKEWSEDPRFPMLSALTLDRQFRQHFELLQACAADITRNITQSHDKSFQSIIHFLLEVLSNLS